MTTKTCQKQCILLLKDLGICKVHTSAAITKWHKDHYKETKLPKHSFTILFSYFAKVDLIIIIKNFQFTFYTLNTDEKLLHKSILNWEAKSRYSNNLKMKFTILSMSSRGMSAQFQVNPSKFTKQISRYL